MQQEHCFCLISFLFLEIQITGVKNSRHNSGSVYKSPVYKTTKNACDSVSALSLYSESASTYQQCKSNKTMTRYNWPLHRYIFSCHHKSWMKHQNQIYCHGNTSNKIHDTSQKNFDLLLLFHTRWINRKK